MKIIVKPHPYLPFIYKGSKNQGKEMINFPIKSIRILPRIKTNSLGLYNVMEIEKR